jgi:hypothetical protein
MQMNGREGTGGTSHGHLVLTLIDRNRGQLGSRRTQTLEFISQARRQGPDFLKSASQRLFQEFGENLTDRNLWVLECSQELDND